MVLRPQFLPATVLSRPLFFSKLYFFSKPLTISPICTVSAAAAAIVTTNDTVSSYFDHSLPYGPSLHKGQKLSQRCLLVEGGKQIEDNLLDEDSFTRVYDLTALRVPSELCFSLENRLRGHLLNWPRIRNIARVPGDEVEEEFQNFIKPNSSSSSNSGDDDSLASLNRRIYGKADRDWEPLGPVLYRDKLAKTFNSKGFFNFRHLAKISRPKKKTRKRAAREEDQKREKRGIGKNDIAVVEVVEEQIEEDGWEDLSGLLGSEFKSRKWRGSSRLLLLDERYANKRIDEMPKAIQAVLNKDCSPSVALTGELVRCKLTLFYKYWQMNEILEVLLPNGMVIPSAFETVGHIAHLNLRDEHLPYQKLITKVVLDKNKPKIQSVVNKVDAIHNDYRTMQLEVLAGNSSLVTTVVENGLRFHVDLATVYWNSRLATERQRLLTCFTSSDVVCDVFSGVGPIAISAARIVKRVYANDLNPRAVEYLERNAVLNKLERKIEVFNMDGRRFIEAIFASERAQSITHVVMNLPNDATEYLDAFRGIFKHNPRNKELTPPKIHVYGFSKAQDPEYDFLERIRIALSEAAVKVEMHRVRLVAPGKWMLCASFILPERVAFAKAMPKL